MEPSCHTTPHEAFILPLDSLECDVFLFLTHKIFYLAVFVYQPEHMFPL